MFRKALGSNTLSVTYNKIYNAQIAVDAASSSFYIFLYKLRDNRISTIVASYSKETIKYITIATNPFTLFTVEP